MISAGNLTTNFEVLLKKGGVMKAMWIAFVCSLLIAFGADYGLDFAAIPHRKKRVFLCATD